MYIDFDEMLDDGLTDYERLEAKREDFQKFILSYR